MDQALPKKYIKQPKKTENENFKPQSSTYAKVFEEVLVFFLGLLTAYSG